MANRYIPLRNAVPKRKPTINKDEPDRWVTVKGAHIPIYKDEQGNDVFGVGKEIEQIEKPIIGGTYKATEQMKTLVMDAAEQMQKDFPILRKSLQVNIDKNVDAAGKVNPVDNVATISGAWLKDRLRYGDRTSPKNLKDIKGTVCHELTHVMQYKLLEKMGLPKDTVNVEKSKNYIDSLWNSAVDRCIKSHSNLTAKEINTVMANSYGHGGHSRLGSSSIEKMAVAVQIVYRGYDDRYSWQTELGRYMIEELQKEMR